MKWQVKLQFQAPQQCFGRFTQTRKELHKSTYSRRNSIAQYKGIHADTVYYNNGTLSTGLSSGVGRYQHYHFYRCIFDVLVYLKHYTKIFFKRKN